MPDPQEAADKEVDPDRLLPGEVEDSLDPVVIAKWTTIYQDLLTFKQSLLETIRLQLPDRLPPVRREIEQVDMVALEAQVERIQRRHEFWSNRRR